MQFPADNFTITQTGTTQVQLCGQIGAIELVGSVGTSVRMDYRGVDGTAFAVTMATLTIANFPSKLLLDTVTFQPGYYDLVCCPTLNPGLVASPPIPTFGASAVCAADHTTIPLAATVLTDAQGCVVARFNTSETYYPNVLTNQNGAALVFSHDWKLGISDSTNILESPGTPYSSGASCTGVTSWGGGIITADVQSTAVSSAYDGSIVASTQYIGSHSGIDQYLNGTIQELWTIPIQPTAEQRAKLARLWA